MDSNIRSLICEASEGHNLNSFEEAYNKLKKERQLGPSGKTDTVSPDLFVLCAETAFKVSNSWFYNNPIIGLFIQQYTQ